MSHREHSLTSSDGSQEGDAGQQGPGSKALLAALLYLLLLASAALALWARRFPEALPQQLELMAPALFLVFVVVFALYRLKLVRARRYPAFKAFFQIGAAALFFTLLLPRAKNRYEGSVEGVEALLADSDARVRTLAAEVAGYRPDGARYGPLLVRALRDRDERVRDQAHRSLVRLNGSDLGGPNDEKAMSAWSERFR